MLLGVSNRGSGVNEIVARTTYAVNLPAQLRGKNVLVEVLNGSMQYDCTDSDIHLVAGLGVQVDWGIPGGNTEAPYGSNQFMNTAYKTLFEVDTSAYHEVDKITNFQMAGLGKSFVIQGFPEKLEFSRFRSLESLFAPTAVVAGDTYMIITTGTTNWTTAGAADSSPNTVFTSTTTSTGTGTAWRLGVAEKYSDFKHIAFDLKLTEVID